MRQLQLHFKNMNPPAELKTYANSRLEKILDFVPKDSICVAMLSKIQNDFEFSLDICSKYGPFVIRTVGKNPQEAIDRSWTKAQEKLLRWTKSASSRPLSPLAGFFPCRKTGTA